MHVYIYIYIYIYIHIYAPHSPRVKESMYMYVFTLVDSCFALQDSHCSENSSSIQQSNHPRSGCFQKCSSGKAWLSRYQLFIKWDCRHSTPIRTKNTPI